MSDLKLGHKKPCKECPFRKSSAPGYFGQFCANDYLKEAHGEAGITCHISASQGHACVGALQHATKSHKVYRNPALNLLQREVGRNDDEILDYQEFVKHHSDGNFHGERKKNGHE